MAATRLILWGAIYYFIITRLHPQLVLTDSIPTGGDLGSHYPSLVYLRDVLLPQGRLVGWQPGNYAGFPQFQMYFPLPFLLMIAGNLFVPLTISFKLVSLAGVLTLPLAAYGFVKNLGYDRCVADLAATATLPFLFMEANSAWGGNVGSTLAGEFTYSLGLSLSLLYLGRLFASQPNRQGIISLAVLLASVGLCHGYTLLFCVLGAAYFLISTQNWLSRLRYLLQINLLAFCLMGFWIVPLLLFLSYSTPFNYVWQLDSWQDVFPPILWPLVFPGVAGIILDLIRGGSGQSRAGFLAYLILIAAAFFSIGFHIGLVDIRFLPFAQLLLVISGGLSLGRLAALIKAKEIIIVGLGLAIITWTGHRVLVVSDWAAWNFSGWTTKPLWPAFEEINRHLRGNFSLPRVAYEHSDMTEGTGTIRAFESLPFFAGRATLEGVYIQACLSSPFVFYLQSEISPDMSAPLSTYNYGRFDLERAKKHLHLFNVSQYVTTSYAGFFKASQTPGYQLEKTAGPFSVFRVLGGEERYVVQPNYRPVLVLSANPKQDSFAWFRQADVDIPVVLASPGSQKRAAPNNRYFAAVWSEDNAPWDWGKLPREPLPPSAPLKETISEEEIIIEGAQPGQPLWIKVSYHPNWQVEGADRVWRTAPSFMMVFPTSSRVRLQYGWTWPDYLGLGLTVLGGIWVMGLGIRRWSHPEIRRANVWENTEERIAIPGHPRTRLVLIMLIAFLSLGIVLVNLSTSYQDPNAYFQRGLRQYQNQEYTKARDVFQEAIRHFPLSPVVDYTWHLLALTYFQEGRYDEARASWSTFGERYPESRQLPEAWYHIGLTYLRQDQLPQAEETLIRLRREFPDTTWAEEAARRLAELKEKTQR